MPRLSIVIPALSTAEALENTLVSVLENRPDDTQILVPLAIPYADPYALEGEVEFVAVGPGVGWAECVNAALADSRGDAVNVLQAGVEVAPDWADSPLALLEADDSLAAVAPVVHAARHRKQIVARGVAWTAAGRRVVLRHSTSAPIVGPSCLAGFYRRDTLEQLGGVDIRVEDSLADVDLTLRLRAAGWKSVVDENSHVFTSLTPAATTSYRSGIWAERLHRRAAAEPLSHAHAISHLALLAGELLGSVVAPTRLLQLLGRLAGRLSPLPEPLPPMTVAERADTLALAGHRAARDRRHVAPSRRAA